jgi:hypothetical protein
MLDPRALYRHVGTRSHGNADVGRSQCRSVVDAVAGHGDLAACGLEGREVYASARIAAIGTPRAL